MPLQDITITSSIKSLATQSYGQRTYVASSDLESFPIESITGSHVGAWPNFEPGTNYTVNLFVNVTQSWSGSNTTPLGLIPYIHNTNDEFFNGEFSGSNYVVTNGNLTDEDCQQFLEVTGLLTEYSIFFYGSTTASLSTYLNQYTSPRNGEILVYYESITVGPNISNTIKYLKVAKIDQEGNDNTPTLLSLTSIQWVDSTVGKLKLNVLSRISYTDYVYFIVSSPTWTNINQSDDNFLNYSLYATSSATFPITGGNIYQLTSSWLALVDSASGFNNSDGQYVFPLTPNFPIIYTASLSITASTNATFSLAINGYDPLSLLIASSIPNTLSTTATNINTIYLDANTSRSLFVSNSNAFFVQDYLYEIDAYALGTATVYGGQFTPNFFITSSTSVSEGDTLVGSGGNTPVPFPYYFNIPTPDNANDCAMLTQSLKYPSGDTLGPLVNGAGVNPFNGGLAYLGDSGLGTGPYLGEMGTDYSVGLYTIFTDITPGTVYRIEVDVPAPTVVNNSGASPFPLGSWFNSDGWGIVGPPLLDVTCSINEISTTDPQYYIGVIPSGASGTFTFDYTVTSGNGSALQAQGGVRFLMPSNSADYLAFNPILNGTGSVFAVTRISVQTASVAPVTALVEVNNVSLRFTQSFASQSFTSSVTFEPYSTIPFITSDCNVLLNNSELDRISTSRRRVLYDDGSIIPSNIEQIISNSAEFANVNDYLYNANANTKPRYLGVRSSSPNFNQNTTEGGYGLLPNVEINQTYFAYYDYITSSYSEYQNTSLAHIKYLIDVNNNIQTPSISSSYYYNLLNNFESGKRVNVSLDATDTLTSIGVKPILRPGIIPRAIAASQTGSNSNAVSSIYFSNNQSTVLVPDFTALIIGTTQTLPIITGGSNTVMNFVTASFTGSAMSASYAVDQIHIKQTAPEVKLNFRLTGTTAASQQNAANYNRFDWIALLQKSTDGGISWLTISEKFVGIIYPTLTSIDVNFGSYTPVVGDKYRVILRNVSGYFSIGVSDLKLTLTQDPIPVSAGTISSPYWTTGSNSKNILTGSSELFRLYTAFRAFQINPTATYNEFLEFDIKPADEIRFQGDENQVYRIKEVIPANSSLYLRLDKNIITTNINSFLLRRLDPNPNFILLDWDGVEYNNGDGFLFPEYMSEDLSKNLDKIIVALREGSLI